MRYKFYIVSGGTFTPTGSGYATISGGTTYDIEKDFDGLLVSKIKGLDDKGEIKNRYTETYADSEKLRVYHPTTPLYKETTIKLDILFSKALRGFELDAFTNLIKGGTLIMYETSRGRCFEFVYMKDTIVSDEKMYGGQPYKEVEFELQNIRGYCDRFVLEVYNIAGVSTYTTGGVYYNGKGFLKAISTTKLEPFKVCDGGVIVKWMSLSNTTYGVIQDRLYVMDGTLFVAKPSINPA